jgi:glycosyltransferase involved in cell wall biosynthesis
LPLVANRVEKAELIKSDIIIAVSREIMEYVKTFGITKNVHVIPAGVDEAKFMPVINKKNVRELLMIDDIPTILFVGIPLKRKGLQFLIDAAEIISHNRTFNLIVVGIDPEYGKYIQDVRSKGLDEYIRFAGKVGYEQLLLYYQASDIYCLPSTHEGLPQSLLESMCVGIPSIASSVGGIPDLIKDGVNGFLIEPGDVDQLVKKISCLLDNPEYCKKIGEEGRRTILLNYTWSAICDQILRVIDGDVDETM